jgi:hypothetical protein
VKIPGAEQLPQVAPQPTRLPTMGATAGGGFDAERQFGNELGAGIEEVRAAYERYQHEERARQTSDGMAELTKRVTDINYGTKTTSSTTVFGNTGAQQAAGTAPSDAAISAATERTVQVDLDLGAPKQTEGFLSTRGEHALSALDPTLKAYDEARKEVAKKMKDPAARKMFEQASAPLLTHLYEQSHAHVAQQLRVAQEDSLKAHLAETLRSVAVNPADDSWANTLVAQTAGAAIGMSTSDADAANKVEAIRAEVADTRARMLMTDTPERPADLPKALEVVKASEHALGEKAEPLLTEIHNRMTAVEAQNVAADIAKAARTDQIFTPLDRDAVAAKLADVPAEKRKAVTLAMDELLTRDAQRVEADKKRFVNSSVSLYAKDPHAFFGTTTANVLREVDGDKYLALEDRLRALDRLAKADNRERLTLQTNLDKMAIDDLRARLEVDPTLNINAFMQEHPELSGGKVNYANALAAKAAKVYEQGLKPSADKFVADFMAEASHKMPTFTGTPQEVKQQISAWKQARRNEAMDIYTDAMDANKGEKPAPEDLTKRKATAILDLPLTNATPDALESNTRAITNLGAPPARAPAPVTEPVRATGQTVTMPDGSVYAVLSDKSVRLLTPAKKKAKK